MSTKKETALITVKQLPEIVQQLESVRDQIRTQTAEALAMPCTEETVKEVKKVRAELRKNYEELENQRKAVINKILEPVEEFKAIYKEYITDEFAPADNQLKEKIDEVQDKMKEEKREKVRTWFNEYLALKGIDFVTFEQSGITVGLNDSGKALQKRAKDFIDKICSDLALIDTQEYKAEILVEYKRTFNVSKAICDVTERMKAIEEEKQKAEEKRRLDEAMARVVQVVEEAADEIPAPVTAPIVIPEAPPEEPLISTTFEANPNTAPVPNEEADPTEEVFRVKFTITATLKDLKKLKTYLTEGGYNYVTEQ